MRTKEEIIKKIKDDNPILLRHYLSLEQIEKYLQEEREYHKQRPKDRDSILREMKEFMSHATGKVNEHKGFTCSTNIEYYESWVWMLSDEEYNAIDWDNYQNYGAPILKQIAKKYNLEWDDEDIGLNNMAEGKPCIEGCNIGCG